MELVALREQIDKIDSELVRLLNKRATIALEIGETKWNSGHTIQDSERENFVINAVVSVNNGPLPDSVIRKIFTEIITACRELQNK